MSKKKYKIAEILKALSVEFEHEFYYMNLEPWEGYDLAVEFTNQIAVFVKTVKKASPSLKVVEFASDKNARFTTPNLKKGKYWVRQNEVGDALEIRINGCAVKATMSEDRRNFAMSWFQTTDNNEPSCWLRLIHKALHAETKYNLRLEGDLVNTLAIIF